MSPAHGRLAELARATTVRALASGALLPGASVSTPAGEFPGWDQVRQELQVEGWSVASV